MQGNRISALTNRNQIGGRLIFCELFNMPNKNKQYQRMLVLNTLCTKN